MSLLKSNHRYLIVLLDGGRLEIITNHQGEALAWIRPKCNHPTQAEKEAGAVASAWERSAEWQQKYYAACDKNARNVAIYTFLLMAVFIAAAIGWAM